MGGWVGGWVGKREREKEDGRTCSHLVHRKVKGSQAAKRSLSSILHTGVKPQASSSPPHPPAPALPPPPNRDLSRPSRSCFFCWGGGGWVGGWNGWCFFSQWREEDRWVGGWVGE